MAFILLNNENSEQYDFPKNCDFLESNVVYRWLHESKNKQSRFFQQGDTVNTKKTNLMPGLICLGF